MQFELAKRALFSIPKIVYWKAIFGKKLHMKWVQALDIGFVLRISTKSQVFIGKETVTRPNVCFRIEEGNLTIGDKCFFNSNTNVTCMEKISIGDGCQIANNVVIVDHDHDYKNSLSAFTKEEIIIGKGVWIGANSVILKGSKIGDHSVIAAGSIVKGEVPANTLFYQRREDICKKTIQ
jgi:acetyltransferase-like isoleucine patch superfamily enzyme